jgi:hypothetical protein
MPMFFITSKTGFLFPQGSNGTLESASCLQWLLSHGGTKDHSGTAKKAMGSGVFPICSFCVAGTFMYD